MCILIFHELSTNQLKVVIRACFNNSTKVEYKKPSDKRVNRSFKPRILKKISKTLTK